MVQVDSNGNVLSSESNLVKSVPRCFVCKCEIQDDWPAFRFHDKKQTVCMGCENEEIEVWRVSLPGDSGGYYDHNFTSMAEGLRHIEVDECFEVHREMMGALKYLSLPEFQGF